MYLKLQIHFTIFHSTRNTINIYNKITEFTIEDLSILLIQMNGSLVLGTVGVQNKKIPIFHTKKYIP